MSNPNNREMYTKNQPNEALQGIPTHRQTHIHQFAGYTSMNLDHYHAYVGTTFPAPYGKGHAHEYMTWTNFADGHRHQMIGRTGPAIPLPDGSHFHYFEGVTTGYTSHQHWFKGATMPASGW